VNLRLPLKQQERAQGNSVRMRETQTTRVQLWSFCSREGWGAFSRIAHSEGNNLNSSEVIPVLRTSQGAMSSKSAEIKIPATVDRVCTKTCMKTPVFISF
jgi:hypothetical protein